MRAGRLDRRIIIQQNTPTRSATGAEDWAWTELDTVWASAKPAGGREFIGADQVIAEQRMIFRIRYRSDVTAKMRVSWDGKLFDIRATAEIGRQEGLELLTVADVT
jgi:SPP1 family predicted phage head-tail adaptor